MNAYFDPRRRWGSCYRDPDLVPDREWCSSFYFQTYRRLHRADASILCLRPIPGTRDDYCGLCLLIPGPLRSRDYDGTKQRAIAAETMAIVAPLVGGPLARLRRAGPGRAAAAAPAGAWHCLLEGGSDTQIAARLRYLPVHGEPGARRSSTGTAGGLSHRSELLARWVRRGWGGRFAWADDQG